MTTPFRDNNTVRVKADGRSLASRFERVDEAFKAIVPVTCLTPGNHAESIRFYDTSPLDASLRYLALTRYPDDSRLPRAGESAEVVIRDLHTGADVAIEQTTAWDTQLGAQPQWHPDRPLLFYNVMGRDGHPHAVMLDAITGTKTEAAGPIYMISPDGKRLASPDLCKIGHAQPGYGVTVNNPPRNTGAPEDDGVWITDLSTHRCELAVSLRHLSEAAALGDAHTGEWYVFHVKWNPIFDRLLVVVRWKYPRDAWQRAVVTCDADGANTRCLVSAEQWARGGHHPNWFPDGKSIVMNLTLETEGALRFVAIQDKAGAPLTTLTDGIGSGHPTLNPAMTHLLTDAYMREPMSRNGTVPLRWINLQSGVEQTLCRVAATPDFPGPNLEWRVDQHPAWCADGRHVAFNGWYRGRRRVFLADLKNVLP